MPPTTKPTSGQPAMNENTPESGPCPVCGADECVGHDFPHISAEPEVCPNCGWTSEPASDLPRWKAMSHILFRDLDVFLCYVIFNILSFSLYSDLTGQGFSTTGILEYSLLFSGFNLALFILFRISVKFLRRKFDSIIRK